MPSGDPRRKEVLLGAAIGAGCFFVAFAARLVAGGWFQSHYPYLTFLLAVMVAAYFAGFWPAMAVTAASALTGYLTYRPPFSSVAYIFDSPAGAITFVVTAGLCGLLISSLRSARDRLELERRSHAKLAETRDLLYRELQHRVSNNIQVVSGLLRVQASGAPPAVSKALREAADRIGLVARIQRALRDQTGAPTPFCDFARELTAAALQAAGAGQVSVSIDGGQAPLHPDQATPVSLVLLECVNNALEHAFADGRTGVIQVDLRQIDGQWRLTVRDDGAGPPAGLDIDQSQTLGLKIMRAMAVQLQGDFIIAAADPGAVCILSYPVLA